MEKFEEMYIKERENELEEIKKIMRENIEDADCGLYDTRNTVGDYMQNLYTGKYFQLDICFYYSYFEIFGTTSKEFDELEEYYEEIQKEN